MSKHIVTLEILPSATAGADVLKFLHACQRLEKLADPTTSYKPALKPRRYEKKRQQNFATQFYVQPNGAAMNLALLFQQAIEHLTKLFRESQESGNGDSPSFIPNYDTIFNICQEINNMPNIRVHTIKDISKKHNISESTLQRNFKKIFQMTVHEYVTMVCMKKAEQLRKIRSMNMEDIAEELGYSDRSGFFKTYKKWQKKHIIKP